MIIDMHIHTSFSPCSIINTSNLLQKARAAGLDGLCITDHDTTASRPLFDNVNDNEELCVIVGMEYATSRGDFLVFGPVEYVPAGMYADQLIGWIKKEGGIAIPAHPFRKSRPTDPEILSSFEIVEALNGRNSPSENESCKRWLAKYGNGARQTGGSDAHTPGEIGRMATVFKRDIYGVEDLINALHSGDYIPQQRHTH
jgi:predicted metal-dependent phosphoesterase TrpH